MIASYDTPDGRYYTTPIGELPSVTTILEATADRAWLEHWRRRVGDAEVARVRREALARGEALHAAVERYLLGGPAGEGPWWASVQHVLTRVTDVELVEAPLYHSRGYAGTVDLIARLDGELVVIDWKTARRPKQARQCVDYGIQAAAYAHAAAELHELEITRALIVVALADRPAQVFGHERAGLDLSWYAFARRHDAFLGRQRHLTVI